MSDKQEDKPTGVSIRILGKDYMVACPKGAQASLVSSAKEVDTKMRDVRRSGKIIGSERIAVMTALNLAHELNSVSSQVTLIDDTILERIDKLQQKIDTTLERINSQS